MILVADCSALIALSVCNSPVGRASVFALRPTFRLMPKTL